MKENKTFYITTPIYYTSGNWHLGTCYTTIVCDALARFKRMDGFDVFFLTGTDEHGQKVEEAAKKKGVSPQQYVDEVSENLKKLWSRLGISYDKFIRTTDPAHITSVREAFRRMYEKGDIYKGEYEGWHCTPCESFWTDSQLVDGKCPDCGREVERTKEESYFFRLSKYQDRVEKLIKETDFLEPESRRNEMYNNFIKDGLQDISVSRTSFGWGIPVPFDDKHVIYVWVDALLNYLTALGYCSEDESLFEKYWPADVHMMAKEIIRFHSIIWPAMLMSLDVPLPEKVFGHGWMLFEGTKMSKSRGNGVDPFVLCDRYGVDSVRYYILRKVPFGSDGKYSDRAFLNALQSDLCNGLGNLLSRTTAMIGQYFGGVLPVEKEGTEFDEALEEACGLLGGKIRECMNDLRIPKAMETIFELVDRSNKYIDDTAPWILAKDASKKKILAGVMYRLAEALRIIGTALKPFLPETGERILADIGAGNVEKFGDNFRFGVLKGGERITKGRPLFGRPDIEKELLFLENPEGPAAPSVPAETKRGKGLAEITIEDFCKTELKTGVILAAEKMENSRKLLHLTVDTGDRTRSIVSGVAKYFAPEELTGREVIVVTNLKPAKLGGVLSEGMILFGEKPDGELFIVGPDKKVGGGNTIS